MPAITEVKPGFESVTLTVLLYAGDLSSFSLNISVFNGSGKFIKVVPVSQSVVSPDERNYTFTFALPPGNYRFSVVAGNTFGSSDESEMFPSNPGMGVEGWVNTS